MGNRYKKLVDIKGVKWSKECPVLLLKGALLYDDTEKRNLLQLKFQSITNDTLAGMEIEYRAYSMGDELLLEEKFSYLDLNVNLNKEFGEKTAIYLKNSDARKFSFSVSKVFFANGKIWESSEVLQDIELQRSMKNEFGNLYDQFQREYKVMSSHGKAEYLPVMEDGSWQCTCGSLNLETFVACRCCGIKKKNLLKILDRSYLVEENVKFQAEEKRRREKEEIENAERQEKEKILRKKIKKVGLGLTLVIIIVVCGIGFWKKEKGYKKDYEAISKYIDNKDYDSAYCTMIESDSYDKLKKEYGKLLWEKQKELDESFKSKSWCEYGFAGSNARGGCFYQLKDEDKVSLYAVLENGEEHLIFDGIGYVELLGLGCKSWTGYYYGTMWSNGWLFVSAISDDFSVRHQYALKYDREKKKTYKVQLSDEDCYNYVKMKDGDILFFSSTIDDIQNADSIQVFDVVDGVVRTMTYEKLKKLYGENIEESVLTMLE